MICIVVAKKTKYLSVLDKITLAENAIEINVSIFSIVSCVKLKLFT